jgi:hypothetical protein
VAFESVANNLVSGDTNGWRDVFVRDRQSGTTERVSVDSAEAAGNSDSVEPSISGDGRYVAFPSDASNLVSGDTNGSVDVFVRDRQSGTTERVSVGSGGAQGNGDSDFASISSDGHAVAFQSSASNLVSGDTNVAEDIFVRDQKTATISNCPGIPPAPDVLTSNAAVIGAPWTATVTSGFARAKAGTWTLFFGSAGVAKPAGIDVGQFPAGGLNFGTNKAGRRLLCNVDASSPSGCANIPLPAGIGSNSSCSALIPFRIGLVCNAWCAQALVVGNVPSGASGGGTYRLTSSVGGVVGTNF